MYHTNLGGKPGDGRESKPLSYIVFTSISTLILTLILRALLIKRASDIELGCSQVFNGHHIPLKLLLHDTSSPTELFNKLDTTTDIPTVVTHRLASALTPANFLENN